MYAKVLRRVRRFLEYAPRLNTELTESTEHREKRKETLTQRRRGS
jgi:hypothetical protein